MKIIVILFFFLLCSGILFGQDKCYNENPLDVNFDFFKKNPEDSIIAKFSAKRYVRIYAFDIKDSIYIKYFSNVRILEFPAEVGEDLPIMNSLCHVFIRNLKCKSNVMALSFYENLGITTEELSAFKNLITLDACFDSETLNLNELKKITNININFCANPNSNLKISSYSCKIISLSFGNKLELPNLSLDMPHIKQVTILRYYDSISIKSFNIDVKNNRRKLDKLRLLLILNSPLILKGIDRVDNIEFQVYSSAEINKHLEIFNNFQPKEIKIESILNDGKDMKLPPVTKAECILNAKRIK